LVAGTLEVLVDSETARDNVTRIAERAGWGITAQDEPNGSLRLILRK
jgi:TusA-related sulfurtransferase